MYLLDTDTLTHLYAGHRRVQEQLQRAQTGNVATTIITKLEIMRGRLDVVLKAAEGAQLLRAQQLWLQNEQLLAEIVVTPIDQTAAALFDKLRNAKLGKIGHADLLIASIVLAHRAILVTRNRQHFAKIPGLIIENWVD